MVPQAIPLTPSEQVFLSVTLPNLYRLRLKAKLPGSWDKQDEAEAEFHSAVDDSWDLLVSILQKRVIMFERRA